MAMKQLYIHKNQAKNRIEKIGVIWYNKSKHCKTKEKKWI